MNLRPSGLQRKVASNCATTWLQRSLNHRIFSVKYEAKYFGHSPLRRGSKNDSILCRSVEPKMTEIWACNVERHSVWNVSQTLHEHQNIIASGHHGHKYTTLHLSFEIRDVFSSWLDTPSGTRLPHCSGTEVTLRLTRSVGILQKGERPVTEISTWHSTTIKRGNIHATGGIRTRNPIKRVAADQLFSFERIWIK